MKAGSGAAWAGVLALVLAGCAAEPRKATEQDIVTQCARDYADPKIDPVRDRIQVPLQIGEAQSIDMLSKRVRATDAEKPAIQALSAAFDTCNGRAESQLGPLPAYRLRTNNRISDGLADLYSGDITYGQFAKMMLYAGERDRIERQQLDEEIRSRERWRILHDHNGN